MLHTANDTHPGLSAGSADPAFQVGPSGFTHTADRRALAA
jgi:hypothetical protein